MRIDLPWQFCKNNQHLGPTRMSCLYQYLLNSTFSLLSFKQIRTLSSSSFSLSFGSCDTVSHFSLIWSWLNWHIISLSTNTNPQTFEMIFDQIQSRQTQTRKNDRFKRDKNGLLVLEREKGCWAMELGFFIPFLYYSLWLWVRGKKNTEIWSGEERKSGLCLR